MGKNNLIKKTTMATESIEDSPGAGGYIPVLYDALEEAPPDFVIPMSKAEQKRRKELEGLIYRNFKAFYDVGCSLREIQQRRLYRATHRTFSAYCKELWDMARRTAYKYIEASNVVDNVRNCAQGENVPHGAQNENDKNFCQNDVHNCGQEMSTTGGQNIIPLPQNERQARALTKFEPDQQRVIWLEAVKTAPKGKISAAHIKKTARILHFEQVRKTIQKAKKNANQAPKINEDFRRAFSEFLDAINIERASEYRNTDRTEVIRHVRVILDALEAEL